MDRFALSFAELDLLGEVLGLDVRPFPFTFDSVGADRAVRDAARSQSGEAMAGRGLITRGRLLPELEEGLSAFANGQVGVAVLGDGPIGSLMARGCVSGSIGVVALREWDGLRFALGRAEDVVPWTVGVLPDYPRGVGDSAIIAVDGPGPAVTSSLGPPPEDFAALSYTSAVRTTRSTAERDREAVNRLLEGECAGTGYLLVEGRASAGRPPVRHSIGWVDSVAAGRFASYTTVAQDGAESIVYTPADFRLLVQKCHEYVTELL